MTRLNKNYWYRIFKDWFKLDPNSQIVLYRNPNDCCHFHNGSNKPNLEHFKLIKTNGHYIYGYRKRKIRRSKGNNPIKIGRVIPSFVVLFDNIINRVNTWLNFFVDNLGVIMCLYYIFIALAFILLIYNIPIVEGIVCLKK